MKTKEELTALKAEVETMSRKLRDLTEDELAQVTGGVPFLTAPFNPGVILVETSGNNGEKKNRFIG